MIKEFKEEKTKPTNFQTNIILQLQSRSISPLGVQKDRKSNTRLEIYLSAVTKLTVTVPQQTARSRPHSPTPDMDCVCPATSTLGRPFTKRTGQVNSGVPEIIIFLVDAILLGFQRMWSQILSHRFCMFL